MTDHILRAIVQLVDCSHRDELPSEYERDSWRGQALYARYQLDRLLDIEHAARRVLAWQQEVHAERGEVEMTPSLEALRKALEKKA